MIPSYLILYNYSIFENSGLIQWPIIYLRIKSDTSEPSLFWAIKK